MLKSLLLPLVVKHQTTIEIEPQESKYKNSNKIHILYVGMQVYIHII